MTKNRLRAVRWWALDYSYAVKRQTRAAVTRMAPEALDSGDLAPVLVIPGIYESWRFLLPLVTQVHERGHPIHVVEGLQLNVRPVIESAAEVSAYLEHNDLTGAIILAHSKGGLIGKHMMVHDDTGPRAEVVLSLRGPTPSGLVHSIAL